MECMDILIVANFCGDLEGKDNNRFIYIAELLSRNNDVEIVTSDFSHNKKKSIDWDMRDEKYKITLIHEPGYCKNVCIKRFLSQYMWGKNVGRYLEKRKKPDVIYCAVPSLTGPNLVAKYCEKNNIRFVIDIQDLWPEAFQMVFQVPVISSLVFAPFRFWAESIYKRADEIVAVSQTYVDRALTVSRKCKKGYSVFLGTELQTFDKNAGANMVHKENEEVWLGYCGTLGNSYDITCVLDALKILKDLEVMVPKFIVMGDGPLKQKFEQYAKTKDVDCVFLGRIPYNSMCSVLSQCDIAINPIVGSSVASIINKHADYAASGLPVINTQTSKEYRDLIEEYKMGINVEPGDSVGVADAILKLYTDIELRKSMGNASRKCAIERFDRKNTYELICRIIQGEKI